MINSSWSADCTALVLVFNESRHRPFEAISPIRQDSRTSSTSFAIGSSRNTLLIFLSSSYWGPR